MLQVFVEDLDLLLEKLLRVGVLREVDAPVGDTCGAVEGDVDDRSARVGYAGFNGKRKMFAGARKQVAVTQQQHRSNFRG